MEIISSVTIYGMSILSSILVFAVAILLLIIIILFIIDVNQTHDAIRKNYPVIGRFRHIFSVLGEFFRQYFFAMDREEMPFNRAERNWIESTSKSNGNTVAFGSTKNLTPVGSKVFVNSAFPPLDEEIHEVTKIIIGENCKYPYTPNSFFNISAMSYGSLSKPAIRALSFGAEKAGCWLNTGEGGIAPYHLEGGADIIFQLGTAKYGARDKNGNLDLDKLKKVSENPKIKMVELKLSQGAKPGKGGILPANKVTEEIAEIRGIEVGKASISPNRHLDVNNVTELLELINKMRDATGKPTGFKSVMGDLIWIREMCEEIKKKGIDTAPDFITIDSGDGGTGAAPMALIDNVGLQIKESLPLLENILIEYGLRDRIKIIASGKLITPADVAWALCCGADFVNSARGFMFALGCIQAMKCNKNTCPTGITTHDKNLQKGLDYTDKAIRVKHYVEQLRKEVETISHSCGVANPCMLKREHVRIVQDNGQSKLLSEVFPYCNN